MGNVMDTEETKQRKDSLNVKRLRKAIKLSENLTFKTKFRSFHSLLTKKRVSMVSEITNKTTFTDRELLMALSLYKNNPNIYWLITKLIVLPPCCILRKLTCKAGLQTGLSRRVYVKLIQRVQRMARTERMCTLLFDELTITQKDKKAKGYLTEHVIVFMIRLIFKNKNQPVAYKFSCQRINENELKVIIHSIISDLQECGLTVVATVCDHDTRNIGAINKLSKETKEEHLRLNKKYIRDTFEVNGTEIVPLFDAPHLMKGIRNDLVTKNLKFTEQNVDKVAKWEHIIQSYAKVQKLKSSMTWPNVTKYHVIPEKINKIDALYAIHTLNRKFYAVVVALSISLEPNPLPEEAYGTVHLLVFFDRLFKSMDGSYNQWRDYKDEQLFGPVTPKSVHEKEWNKFIIVLNTMKFITKDDKEIITHSLISWIRTLDNIRYLSRKLFVKHGVKGFWMSRFNMDPLVKFVERIQKKGCRNINTYRLIRRNNSSL